MPWTESGPAASKKADWDYCGHVPVSRRERLDCRFKNSISKPQPNPADKTQRKDDKLSKARGLRVAADGIPPWDKPKFDKGKFRTREVKWHLPEYGCALRQTKAIDTDPGAAVPAVCEDASCGGNVSAKSTAKFGSTSYEYLNRRARSKVNLVAATVANAPPKLGRLFAAAIMKSKLFRPQKITRNDGRKIIRHTILVRHNGRLLRHIFRAWFGRSYPWRWDQAASCYLDVRIDGRATNSADLTWGQAAARMANEATGNFSTRQYRHEGRRCPLIFYEKPFLCIFLFWLMAGLDAPLSDFWFFVAEPPNTEEEKPRRYIPSNVYNARKRHPRQHESRRVSLRELLSVNSPRLARFYRECWRRVAEAINRDSRPVALTARDKIIMSHWTLAAKKCREWGVPKGERADAIQCCVERLVTVWKGWDSESGVPFGAFAAQAIDWEIQDFLKRLRRQVPVQRSINLNDLADNRADDDDDDKPPEPERPDMMRLNAVETQATAAKRRLVADSLGCLNLRERRVIEGRLALNGHKSPVSHETLATEFGMSERHIKRIEMAAVEKLQQAVL